MESILDALPKHKYQNFNIIDLGCGEGSPLYPIFRHIQLTMPKSKYNPIDLSPDLLRAASTNIARTFKVSGKSNKWERK